MALAGSSSLMSTVKDLISKSCASTNGSPSSVGTSWRLAAALASASISFIRPGVTSLRASFESHRDAGGILAHIGLVDGGDEVLGRLRGFCGQGRRAAGRGGPWATGIDAHQSIVPESGWGDGREKRQGRRQDKRQILPRGMAPIQRAGLRGPPPATRLITRPFLRPGEQLPEDFGVLPARPEAAALVPPVEEAEMSSEIDAATVRRIAHLARVAVADDEVEHLRRRDQRHPVVRRAVGPR